MIKSKLLPFSPVAAEPPGRALGLLSRSTPMVRKLVLFLLTAVCCFTQKPSFTVGWSIYAGWTPYYYLNKSGILRKWADKYNVAIKVQRFDYAPSLDAFVAKNIDACAMTNMEALDMPAASGVPTTSILIGDYSNGNDAVLVRNNLQLKDLAAKKMLLVEKTVSEYLFDRAMTINGMRDQIKKVRMRSEERRVGKECRSRESPYH